MDKKVIDLDAYAAARREAKKVQPQVRFGGETFELPVEMPFAVVEAVRSMQNASERREQDEKDGKEPEDGGETTQALADIAKALFGARYRQFLDLGASMDDVTALLEHISVAYAAEPGESSASES